ncbi:hypothetical protein ABFP33_20625 [Acinetobacter bereziniae]|uniref:hypothetical protein n=1 Tax=Acinetobacter bereziniae TaxID=106648 RepID=UPI003212E07E
MTKKKSKPREAAVNIHIEQGDSIEGTWSQEEQKMTLRVMREGQNISAKKIEFNIYYMRDSKKPKFLNRIEFNKSSDFTLSHSDAIKQFDHCWAIDTNKKEIFGEIANISVITEGDPSGSGNFKAMFGMVFGLTVGNPELYAWRKFISFIMANIEGSSSKQFALIVDSELDKIGMFNERKLPLHGDFFLPENWSLIYATSDSGKESIFNKMLSESDNKATKLINWAAKLEKNVKHWQPISDENTHQPTFLSLQEIEL